MIKRKKSLLTGILCGIFVAVLLVSGALIAAHAQHDCTGGGCPVCAAISNWERLLRGMALAAALGSVSLLIRCASGISASVRLHGASAHTLVTLKVKLSD